MMKKRPMYARDDISQDCDNNFANRMLCHGLKRCFGEGSGSVDIALCQNLCDPETKA